MMTRVRRPSSHCWYSHYWSNLHPPAQVPVSNRTLASTTRYWKLEARTPKNNQTTMRERMPTSSTQGRMPTTMRERTRTSMSTGQEQGRSRRWHSPSEEGGLGYSAWYPQERKVGEHTPWSLEVFVGVFG